MSVKMKSQSKRPLLRFVLLLGGFFLLFNIAFYGWIAESKWFEKYLALNALASVPVIELFGADVRANGTNVGSEQFSMEIKHGCDALQPASFFILAMLSSPVSVSLRRRLLPILIGTAALLMLNIVRLVTLFYTGLHFPSWFETLHLDIWQAVFIFTPLVFWIGWVLRANRRTPGIPKNAIAQ